MEIMSEEPAVIWHQPVMGGEVLQALHPQPGQTIVDATVGTGGHSFMILPHLLPSGRLIAIDRDADALGLAKKRLTEFDPQVTFIHDNFRNVATILEDRGEPQVDGILVDLGMSSAQLGWSQRGFSFAHEGPHDMRMDVTQPPTAEALINELPQDELAMLFETLGEERFASTQTSPCPRRS